MGIITEPPKELRETGQTQTGQLNVANAQMGKLDNLIAEQTGMTNADLEAVAKRAYTELAATGSGGTRGVIEALDTLQQTGAINADIAAKFRVAATTADGNADRFAQEIVRERQSLAQLMLAQSSTQRPPTAPGSGAQGAASATDNPFMKLLTDPNSPLAKMLDTLFKALSGGSMTFSAFMRDAQQTNTRTAGTPTAPGAAPPAPATSVAAAPPAAAGAPPTTAPPAPPAVSPAPAAATASGESPVVTTLAGGSTYDVDRLPGGGAAEVDLEAGETRIGGQPARMTFAYLADPPADAVTLRSGLQAPAIQQASLTQEDYGLGVNWNRSMTA